MKAELRDRLNEVLARLPEENLRALLDVLQRLAPHESLRRWSPAIGVLSDEDAAQMRLEIEQAFEGVERAAW